MPFERILEVTDYSIWTHIAKGACAKRHDNLDSLKLAVAKEWEDFDMDDVKASCRVFRTRLEKVIGGQWRPD